MHFPRRVIGWALDRSLEDDLAIAALRMALRSRSHGPALLHHSDRGAQYASQEYTDLLKEREIGISVSGEGNPYDNAKCESFMKTLKYEEVHGQEYRGMEEARASIEHFMDEGLQPQAAHSALGYCPPVEFERSLVPSASENRVISKSEGALECVY